MLSKLIVFILPLLFILPGLSLAKEEKTQCLDEETIQKQVQIIENMYVRRQYENVRNLIIDLTPQKECIDNTDIQLELELMLAVAYLETSDNDNAEKHFLDLLNKNPNYDFEQLITIPKDSTKFIDELKIKYHDELQKSKQEQENPSVVVQPVYVLVEKEHHLYWINFLPFAVGSFQNQDTAWAITYASIQGLGLATTILAASMIEYHRGSTYTFSPKAKKKAKIWQAIQITGIALFGTSYIASVIHALINYEDSATFIHPPSLQKPTTSISPFFDHNTLGIAISTPF